MKTLMVLRAGDVPPPIAARRGEYMGWIRREVGGAWAGAWAEHDVRGEAPLPSLEGISGFVLTGSSHSVTERAPWMRRYEAFLRRVMAEEVPVFGICFGHQILAQAMGGLVEKNPLGREIGTRRARRTGQEDPILEGLPDEFEVNTTHVDSVTRLPEGARVLLSTRLESYAAYALGDRARAVQFHPEIDGDAMRGWVEVRAPILRKEGLDPEALHASATDAPHGARMLRNFVETIVHPRTQY